MENPAEFDAERWKKLSRIAYFKAYSVLEQEASAQDVSQAAIEEYLNKFEQIESPEKWISVVARNMANDMKTRRSGVFQARQILDQDPESNEDEQKLKNLGFQLKNDLTNSQIFMAKEEVEEAFENLSEKEQLIISLSVDGYSQAEVAEILGYKDNKVVANLLQRLKKRNFKEDW